MLFHSFQSLLKVTKIPFFSDKEHFHGYKGLRCDLCHHRRHRGRRYISETAVYECMATNMNRSGYCPSLEHASPLLEVGVALEKNYNALSEDEQLFCRSFFTDSRTLWCLIERGLE